MQHVTSLLLLAEAVSVFAAPATETTRKDTFSVSQVRNRNFQQRNGRAALLRAYAKYNIKSNIMTVEGGNDGEITANSYQDDLEYLCDVLIGGQTMSLDFDTGSSDLWVVSTDQPANQTALKTNLYNPSKSSTWKQLKGYSWEIGYGDGSGASGIVGTDVVNVGGTTVTSAAVEVATSMSAQFQQDAANQGLLGLAYPSLNTVSPVAQTPFFFKAMSSLSSPVFTADLKHQAPGTYDFGYIDTSKYTGQIAYTDVQTNTGFWQFTSTGYKVNGTLYSHSANSIADTGTTLLLVDDAIVTQYYSAVPSAVNDDTQGGYVFPCNTVLPDIALQMGSAYYAEIPGSLMSYAPIEDGSSTCFGSLQSNGGAGFQIFGDIMFKSQFVVFNGKTNQVGFAPKAGMPSSPTQPAPTQSATATPTPTPTAAPQPTCTHWWDILCWVS